MMIALFFLGSLSLASCSRGDKGTGPSLDADNRWDWMVQQRQKPLPVAQADPSADASAKTADKIPTSSPPLSAKDIHKQRKILQMAAGKYHDIAAALDRDIRQRAGMVKKIDRKMLWQTMQLHFSRLVSLQKNMTIAINELETASAVNDKNMLKRSRDLAAVITRHIERTRKYLDNFNPNK